MMKEQRGLPIAAYLAILVALALAAAFIATLAIVIWLPPRPPDVMRSDIVADNFQAGYDHMIALGRPLNERGTIWEVRAEPPREEDGSPYIRSAERRLAQALDLQSEQVRMAASHIASSDVFVFRVMDNEDIEHAAEAAGEEAARWVDEVHRAHEEAAERLQEARERAREATDARRAAQEAGDIDEHDLAEIERAAAADEARIEAQAERLAERQARAAERLARRIERRVRVENGQVIISDELAAPEAPAPPDTPEAPEPAPAPETQTFTFSYPSPPAPVAPPAPPGAPAPPTVFAPAPPGVVLISGFEVGAQLPDGRWLVMRQGRNWAEIGWIARAALIIAGALAVLSVLALLFARRLTRPIRNFSEAVQAVGVNPQSEPVTEEGPRELRGAARAVNTMQARLRALIADRTKTLAAVAHDMRTPLMRLRLAAENASPEQRERMAKEIGEVEALVASFIAFARDDPAEEARVRLDLTALLQSIADDHAEARRGVAFEGQERVVVTGQSLGLKRVFANLVENALKYGGSARISMRREEGAVIVDVEDDGPGIPVDQRDSVFEPFVRLNDEGTRGAGLGLAAARSIARAHGGDIAILDSERGARVRVTLPA